jgi:hypothetical protein
LEQEELKWRQRAKEHWLKEGDHNTKFFHESANQKRKSSHSYKILDVEGWVCDEQNSIGQAFIRYYSHLFSIESMLDLENCLRSLKSCVTPAMNASLVQPFTIEEVSTSLNQMSPLKVLGPNGFSVNFFQTHWGTVGPVVSRAVIESLNTGNLIPYINSI